jgi:RNA polymerase sigma-70 factor, ECF subfamily
MENDKYYVERCLDGHPDDFRHLVRRYQPVLLTYLVGKLGRRDWAEDAAQEALVRAYFNIGKLQRPESFYSWLLGIAQFVAKEQQKKELTRRKHESVRALAEVEETPEPDLPQNYGLKTVVAGLPETYRRVILLRYYGGLSCRQVAEQLDMPMGTVTVTMVRAYALLRNALQRQEMREVKR